MELGECKDCLHLIEERNECGKHIAVCRHNELINGFVETRIYERPYGCCKGFARPKESKMPEIVRYIQTRGIPMYKRKKVASNG